ncbi:RepB family plasmid replication initiator protein [Staphylococcus epidermidis]|nr:RepB family plasmid replication initiator protein [Staphylococcus epidermidis]
MTHINQKVLTPIINELSFIFNNLNINKIKYKKGRKIEWLEFTFDAEKRIHNKRQPQMAIGNSRQYINREKIPKWLKNERSLSLKKDTQLEKDLKDFKRYLELKWGEK